MKSFLGTTLMATTLLLATSQVSAGEHIAEKRSVDARAVKIKLGGKINLELTQGATPSLTLHGEKKELAQVRVSQNGDTLQIDSKDNSWNFGSSNKHEVRAVLTLPNMNELVSTGVGVTEVKGFTGERLTIVLDGAGAIDVDSQYRNTDARLGGVGSMTLNTGNSEQVDLHMRGAGQVTLTGNSKLLRAKLGGVGSLDARKLIADAVELDMSGLGGASVHAKKSAKLELTGLGSAKVYGKPTERSADSRGLGNVSWQ